MNKNEFPKIEIDLSFTKGHSESAFAFAVAATLVELLKGYEMGPSKASFLIAYLKLENEKLENKLSETMEQQTTAVKFLDNSYKEEIRLLKEEIQKLKEKVKSYSHIGEGTLTRYKEEIISQRIAKNPERKLSDLLNLNKNIGKLEKSEQEEMFINALREIQKAVHRVSGVRIRVDEIVTEVLKRLGVNEWDLKI